MKALKEIKIKKLDFINIIKMDVLIYYYLTRNKENKLFSLIMNKIYDIFIKFLDVLLRMKQDNRISINKSCSCGFEIKYKRCYKSYILKNTQINNIKILTSQKIFNKFFIDYYNYANVFNKL